MKEPTKKPRKVKEQAPLALVETPPEMDSLETSPETESLNSVKSIFASKTIWVNLLSIIALVLQKKYGFVIDEAIQIEILGFINIALRMITKEPVVWSK